jgi:hypothetical protein
MKELEFGGKGMGRNRWIKMSTILVSPSVVYSVSCEMCGSNRKSLMEPDPRASSQSQWSIYNSPPLFLFVLRILFRQWAFLFFVNVSQFSRLGGRAFLIGGSVVRRCIVLRSKNKNGCVPTSRFGMLTWRFPKFEVDWTAWWWSLYRVLLDIWCLKTWK